MNKKRILVLISQIFVSVITLLAVIASCFQIVKPIKIYRYNKDILPNQIVSQSDLEVVSVPNGILKVFSDVITDSNLEEVFENESNAVMIADSKLHKGDMASILDLVPDYDADPFADINYDEYRMVSLAATYNDTFGGDIARGDLVDLIHVRETKDELGTSVKAEKFLDNVLIYSLTGTDGDVYKSKIDRNRLEATMKNVSISLTGGENGYGTLGTVTLLCTIEDAEEIYARQKTGQIKLAGKFSDAVQNTSGYEIRK